MARDKSDAFKRLAERRVNEALEAVRKIGNLSNRGNYSFTDDQVEKIFAALRTALDTAEAHFRQDEEESDTRFTL